MAGYSLPSLKQTKKTLFHGDIKNAAMQSKDNTIYDDEELEKLIKNISNFQWELDF